MIIFLQSPAKIEGNQLLKWIKKRKNIVYQGHSKNESLVTNANALNVRKELTFRVGADSQIFVVNAVIAKNYPHLKLDVKKKSEVK